MEKTRFFFLLALILFSLNSCKNNVKQNMSLSHEIDSKVFNDLFILEIDSFIKTNKIENCDICVDIYSKYRDIYFYIKCVSPKYNDRNKPLNYIVRRGLKVYLNTSLDELACNYNDSARFNRNEYQKPLRCWYVEMRNDVSGIYESKELVPKNYKIQFVDTTGRTIYGVQKVEPIFNIKKKSK